ncbi:MAG: hypothetical protein A3B70_02925 [Deltaproteobacteria bacterium RIFCSPHIGHO2_02_FULL_40_11]|nr:MAG: hypothetical protein A3B70_02925 [Deltaproteobacteria bacterium RIFCSPHIGHO2_02_FULL_40_11]
MILKSYFRWKCFFVFPLIWTSLCFGQDSQSTILPFEDIQVGLKIKATAFDERKALLLDLKNYPISEAQELLQEVEFLDPNPDLRASAKKIYFENLRFLKLEDPLIFEFSCEGETKTIRRTELIESVMTLQWQGNFLEFLKQDVFEKILDCEWQKYEGMFLSDGLFKDETISLVSKKQYNAQKQKLLWDTIETYSTDAEKKEKALQQKRLNIGIGGAVEAYYGEAKLQMYAWKKFIAQVEAEIDRNFLKQRRRQTLNFLVQKKMGDLGKTKKNLSPLDLRNLYGWVEQGVPLPERYQFLDLVIQVPKGAQIHGVSFQMAALHEYETLSPKRFEEVKTLLGTWYDDVLSEAIEDAKEKEAVRSVFQYARQMLSEDKAKIDSPMIAFEKAYREAIGRYLVLSKVQYSQTLEEIFGFVLKKLKLKLQNKIYQYLEQRAQQFQLAYENLTQAIFEPESKVEIFEKLLQAFQKEFPVEVISITPDWIHPGEVFPFPEISYLSFDADPSLRKKNADTELYYHFDHDEPALTFFQWRGFQEAHLLPFESRDSSEILRPFLERVLPHRGRLLEKKVEAVLQRYSNEKRLSQWMVEAFFWKSFYDQLPGLEGELFETYRLAIELYPNGFFGRELKEEFFKNPTSYQAYW